MGVPQWVFGVMLSCAAGIINAAGIIMQKRSHSDNIALPEHQRRSYLCTPMWLIGFAIYVLGNIANAFALVYAPQSIITPLNSVTLVANAILAPMFLGETITRVDIAALTLIIGGCSIAVVFGSHEDISLSLLELLDLYTKPAFIIFACVAGGLLLIAYFIAHLILQGIHAAIPAHLLEGMESSSAAALLTAEVRAASQQDEHTQDHLLFQPHSQAATPVFPDLPEGLNREIPSIELSVRSISHPHATPSSPVSSKSSSPANEQADPQLTDVPIGGTRAIEIPSVAAPPPDLSRGEQPAPVSNSSDSANSALSQYFDSTGHSATDAAFLTKLVRERSDSIAATSNLTRVVRSHLRRIFLPAPIYDPMVAATMEIPISARIRFLAVAFAAFGGALSSVNIFMTKTVGELISMTSSGDNQFANPLAYVFFGVLIVSNISSVYWMQRALQLFDALIVVPMFQVTFTVLSILTGAFYFQEIYSFTALQAGLFPLGVMITIGGTYLLSMRDMDSAIANEEAENPTHVEAAAEQNS